MDIDQNHALLILKNKPDDTAEIYEPLTDMYYRTKPCLQYWHWQRWNDSAHVDMPKLASCGTNPLFLKDICPDTGRIVKSKYDWSLANPDTKLITTDADGTITEWIGDISSELCVVVSCDYIWKRNPDNGFEQNNNIHMRFVQSKVQPFKGNWQASAELHPSLRKKPYQQLDFLNFFYRMALQSQVERREFDLGVSPDSAYTSPFVTPESVVNDTKAGQS